MYRRFLIISGLCLLLTLTFSFFCLGGETPAPPTGQAETTTETGPFFPDEKWEVWEDPSSRGWIPAALEAAEKHFHTLGATGLMVIDDGRVVAEWGDTSRPVACHSVRKSFLSALYGIEVSQGTIDLSATLADLQIDDRDGLTPSEKQAKVIDLLKALSGVYHNAASETATMRKKRPERGSHAPGEFWYYNNWDFNALGTIFREKTGRDIFKAFDEDIATPLQMQDFHPSECKYHFEKVSDHPAYIYYMSVRDRARFGLLYMNNGRWKDKQVIPATWVEESTTPYSKAGKGIGYGYLWWVSTGSYHLKNKVRGKAFSARGYWGQYIVILPEHKLVVAMATDKAGGAPRLKSSQFSDLLKMILRSNSNYLLSLGES